MKKVYVKNPESFDRKRNALITEGISHLHIISDFDKTLTKSNSMGSFTVIERSSQMSDNFREVMLKKFNHYHAIEKSPTISREEKSKHMMAWTEESVEEMIKDGMNIERFAHILENQPINLRDRATELFDHLDKHKIPLLVFSAGVGDVILNLLKKFTNGHLPNNIHIIANWVSWDNEGKFNGIKGQFIHSMNKNEHSVPRDSEYYQDVVKRKNAILLGDNVGDVHMSEGLSHDTVLKIGFLNGYNEETDKARLEEFESHFDVVITNDESFDYVLDLVDNIIRNS